MDEVFLDIEKAFDITWHLGLLYKLSELKFLISLVKLISSFLSQRKFRFSVEGTMSSPRDICTSRMSQGSILSPTLYIIYLNDTPQTPGVYIGLFADGTCLYATDPKEGCVHRSLQQGLSAIETRCERWHIKSNEDKMQAIYFSHRLRPCGAHFILNGQSMPFISHIK
jgi:hypothetical protein